MPPAPDARARLRADCTRCAGLCCVAPAFAASADFAIDEPVGQACPNLGDDDRCGIHAQPAERRTRRRIAVARGDAATVLPSGPEHPPHWIPR